MSEAKILSDKELSQMAKRLQLSFTRDHMAEMLEKATGAKMTPRETIQYFFASEISSRDNNRFKLALVGGTFPHDAFI